jgi:hypothetical protein
MNLHLGNLAERNADSAHARAIPKLALCGQTRPGSWPSSLLTLSCAAMVCLNVHFAHAQTSQFLFDPVGNLVAETSETGALPQIIQQPQMQVVIPGDSASFSVVLADPSGASYQWFFISTAIPGATTDTLLLTNAGAANQGPYWVAVSNAFGSVASVLANLYIDSRGSGMPDSWQQQYFGNLNQNALGDYDGSGDSNLQDFLDGSNPTNAASALYRITLLNDGGTVVVSPNQSTYTNGQIVTLTATGLSSVPFHAWTGDVTTRSNSITVAMTNNRTLFAHFLPFSFVWTNAANITAGDWNDASNWVPNLVPGSNESVIIGGGANVVENSNVDLLGFTFGNATDAGLLSGSGRITIAGSGIWNNGTMIGPGAMVVKAGASLSIVGSSSLGLISRTLENSGLVVWAGGNFSFGGVITNDAGAQFQILGAASFNNGGGAPHFDNAGALVLANNGSTTFNDQVAFNDYGTVSFPSGTLTLGGGGILAGPLSVPAGSAIILDGGTFSSSSNLSLTGSGALNVSFSAATLDGTINLSGSNIFGPGASVDFTGNYICTNNTMLIDGADVGFDGTGLVAPSMLNLSGGFLGGGSVVTVGTLMNWSGGSMNGTGRTVISPGATLNFGVANPNALMITSRTLDNAGTANWSGTGQIWMDAAVITNRPGALFNVQNATLIRFAGGTPRFDNAGKFLKSLGTGPSAIDQSVFFTNYGTVEVDAGVLAFSSPAYVQVGGATVLNGGSISNSQPLQILGGTLTGSGLISGSVMNAGLLSPGSPFGQTTIAGSYTQTANGALAIILAGPNPGTGFNSLVVDGAANLGGALTVMVTNGFELPMATQFQVLSCASRAGVFSDLTLPAGLSVQYSNNAVFLAEMLQSPQVSGGNFTFNFQTASNQSYTIQQNTNLSTTNWLFVTNIIGSGSVFQFAVPATNTPQDLFRVRQP